VRTELRVVFNPDSITPYSIGFLVENVLIAFAETAIPDWESYRVFLITGIPPIEAN
jgi:hypothetical protein